MKSNQAIAPPSYLTDLTLCNYEVEFVLSSEIWGELVGKPHYTQANGDIRWYCIPSELFHRVCAHIKAKRAAL